VYSAWPSIMRCPKCGCQDDKVIDSRSSREGATIRRRRECIGCGYRYTTYEIIERPRLLVLKRDGRTEEFSRDKLVASIEKACQKRPVTQETIAALVERIVDDLSNQFDREVPYGAVGAKVMESLRGIDPVAYVRYASIYRRFDEATDFVQEVKKLEKPHDTLTARLPGI
jgi:transcriptional repressor NrdR